MEFIQALEHANVYCLVEEEIGLLQGLEKPSSQCFSSAPRAFLRHAAELVYTLESRRLSVVLQGNSLPAWAPVHLPSVSLISAASFFF